MTDRSFDRLASAALAAQATEAEAFKALWQSDMPRFVADGAKEDAQQWFSAGWQACAAAPAAPVQPSLVAWTDIEEARKLILECKATDLLSGDRPAKKADRSWVYQRLCRAAVLLIAEPAAHPSPVQLEQPTPLTEAATDVLAERRRQVESEGWTPAHDDEHDDCSLARAAACYATGSKRGWPWRPEDFKDTGEGQYSENHRRMLVKAGALILAEIERVDRAIERAHGIGEQPTQYGDKSRLSHDPSTGSSE